MRPLFVFIAIWFALFLMSPGTCPATALETVAELQVCPGNITVTPDSRIIISLHPFYSPRNRVVEITKDGKLVPFPDAGWNSGAMGKDSLDSVLGVQCDTNGVVWMLDNGIRGGSLPKLVGWDTAKNRLIEDHPSETAGCAA